MPNGAEDRQTFLRALSDQYPVEGVAVVHRYLLEPSDVIEQNRQDLNTVLRELPPQVCNPRSGQRKFSYLDLDQNFTDAANAAKVAGFLVLQETQTS